jgi:integrase/recombinase XerD
MMLAGPLLQRYFTDYLIAQRRLSPQTLASYRDTFRLLLQFMQSELKIEPSRLAIDQLEADIILRFLDSLEQQRKNAVA